MSLAARLIRCCTQPRVFDTEELDLSHSNLLEVPVEVLSRSRHLVALSLNANAIRNLPFEFYTLNKLTHLDLSDNDIEKLSDLIKNISLLKALDLSKNALSSLPNTIQHCIRLEALELSVNPLGSLPEHLTLLQYLQELYINDIYLDTLPTSIGRLTNLAILEARDNHLADLPRSLINLTLLKRLDLGNNQLTFLSPVIGHLSSLEELWVDSNHLKTLPRDLCYLSNLQFLEVSKNRLEYLPDEMDCLTSLTDLHLSDNYLQTLPESISSLKNLNILHTNNNHLQSLPNGIGRLCYLEELSVSDNRIKDIPPSIGSLKHLNHFNADNNELTSLRSEISGCMSLSILSVRNNYLQTLPREISFLSNLVVVNISGNRLQYMPFTLTRLKKLLALWIIENQTRPLIEMEPKELDCGEKVLVCFLFPQMPPNEVDDVYSRGKFNSDNESLGTDVFSEMPHNSSIMFDVVESTSRTENYPKDIYSRQQPKRFSRNSESPYATLSAITADCENYIPSRTHYYAGRYAKTQPCVAKVDNSRKEHIYSHISEDSHSGSNQPLIRNTQSKQQLSSAPSKTHSLCSDPINTPGYVSSNASGTSNAGGVNTVSTELHTTATHSLGTSPDVSLLQTNNNNKECRCQSGDVSHKLSLPGLQQGCHFSKQFMHNLPRPCMSEIGFPSHTLPHRTQYSPLNTYKDCHPDLTSPPLSCPDTSRYVSQHHFKMAPENARQPRFPPRGQIYEATIEMDPDYPNVSCQSAMFSPNKPLPVPQSTDVYYSDVGMNIHGGYQKLLKEMNIPNDPSSIQALLQLSAHLANQNIAAPHNQNRYPGEQQSVYTGTGTNRSHSGTNLLHSSSNSPNSRNSRSQSNHMMEHCCHRVPSPFYMPSSQSHHQPPNPFTPPCDCCIDTSGHMCATSHLEKTVSHSCTPNTDISSMVEAGTADSGISSVKADTPAPAMCHSETETNHNGMHKHLSIQSIDSNESEVYHVTLCKDPNVGLIVIGRTSVGTGTEGIFVSQVQSDGPAGISKKIRPGDRILEINGFSLNNATQQEAVELLKIAVGNVELKLRKEKLSTLL